MCLPPDHRGAYLRSLAFGIDGDGGSASGSATNRSPGTQLTGFSYTFDGTVVGARVAGDIQRHDVSQLIPVTLDEAGEAALVQLTE